MSRRPAYQKRLAELQSKTADLRASHANALAILVASIILAAFLGYSAIARHNVPVWFFVATLPVAAYAGITTRKRHASLLRTQRLQAYYQRGVKRLNGEWQGEAPTGIEFTIAEHRYEHDLNILGDGSLFQLLCTCRTQVGRRQLALDLLLSASIDESLQRQQAIRELEPRDALREDLQVLGAYSFQQSNWETITDWLESAATRAPLWFRAISFLSSLALVCLLITAATRYVHWADLQPWIVGCLLLNAALAMQYREQLLAATPAILALGNEISVLQQGLALLQRSEFRSPYLSQMANKLLESDAAGKTRMLERLIGAMAEKDKEWFYAISRALLVGTQLFVWIERWKADNAEAMLAWLGAWGEFESLMALATYAHENPAHCYPEFAEKLSVLEGRALGHPLLPPDECVRNDISLGQHNKLYIVSGSNMAGKSTLLRTIGLNVVLANAGAPVCAQELTMSGFSLCASLSVQDSLISRRSKFLAEMEKLKQALQSPSKAPVLFLIDEILSGTNSKDRRAASEAIVRSLIERGAMGALSTHDLALTELAHIPELAATNVHMGSRNDDDPLDFDYLVKPGVTTQSSALAIARLAGVLI